MKISIGTKIKKNQAWGGGNNFAINLSKFLKKKGVNEIFMLTGYGAMYLNDAIQSAKKDDVVLIAGKGHEEYQIIGETKKPHNDLLFAKEVLASCA